jgi:hypothetical protein
MTRIASEDPKQARKDDTLRKLLDNYEQAVIDRHEAEGIPDRPDSPCYDEEQADIDATKVDAFNRHLRIRKRVFDLASIGQVDGIVMTIPHLTATCEEARVDEANRIANWMLKAAGRLASTGASVEWEEAQFLFRYASLIRDLTPFRYTPPPEQN